MYHTLWHNLCIVLTIFPGIILFCMNRFFFLRKISELDKYVVCLALVVFANLLNNLKLMTIVVIIIIFPICFFTIEYIINNKFKLDLDKFKFIIVQIKRPIYVMIMYPIFEELIYRYYIYDFVKSSTNSMLIYCFISTSVFIFVHFFNQQIKCFYKLPLAIVESILFYIYINVFICIVIHMSYNILIYSYNTLKYSTKRLS